MPRLTVHVDDIPTWSPAISYGSAETLGFGRGETVAIIHAGCIVLPQNRKSFPMLDFGWVI